MESREKVRVFPVGFLWGAATSSHQVEGGNWNDWAIWESDGHAKDMSGRACGHWDLERFTRDADLLPRLSLNAYRMSLEWSRLMPRPHTFDAAALQHYRRMLEALKARGLTVMVTLHHFTNPLWFSRSGGWRHGRLEPFLEYVDFAVRHLDDLVDLWATINEPMAVAIMGWLLGQWPPGRRRDVWGAVRVVSRMCRTHNRAYRLIRSLSRKPAGLVHSMIWYEAASPRRSDRLLARLADLIGNQWVLRRTRGDFIGVNYYMRECWSWDRFFPPRLVRLPPRGPVSDFGWEISPDGLYHVLRSLRRYRLPVFVTENGIADRDDRLRGAYIRDHLRSLHQALREGVPVRGYFHWSLLDNFEWAEGFTKRFGLVETDFATGRRRIRTSARIYAGIAATNALEAE
ncbi:hypothetical protein AMJ57_04710 [Parcubacteria bacterium SG8_24]|nr:MAG: hypothetical protein AMJ57_04710 [Parcubacteria bacterium SG8_24]